MNTEHLEQAITDIEQQLAAILDLESKANNLQEIVNETSQKELAMFADEKLSDEEKTDKLIGVRHPGRGSER